MIDFHSHILPSVDDGSQSVDESILLLKMLAEQGIDTVLATPHFLANNETVDRFLERRESSLHKLLSQYKDGLPKILLGAEVKYYYGISRLADLKKLRIENSNLILIEMPCSRWTEYTVRELIEIAGMPNVTVVLAHIERYFGLQSKKVWQRLCESGILMQVNATFFTSICTRRKAFAFLRQNLVHFIGSDCHNTTSRAPCIGKAYEVIEKKLGDDFLELMDGYARSKFA